MAADERGQGQTMLQSVYNIVRPHLPRRIGVYNGIPARADRLLDRTDVHPNYNTRNIRWIRELSRPGDHVCIVGGGIGITSVVAAKAVGDRGRVTIYEADRDRCAIVRETLELNGVAERATVYETAVGPPRHVKGAVAGAVAPDEVFGDETIDVVELDIEGAEADLVEHITTPRAVVVETHGWRGAPTSETLESLRENGYDAEVDVVKNEANDHALVVATAGGEDCVR